MTFKKHQIMFNVGFHSWLCIIFSTYSQYTEVLIGFMLCNTTSIFRQIAQIEHFSYAYFRVLFLACDGRRRGDPNVIDMRPSLTFVMRSVVGLPHREIPTPFL